MSTCIQVNCGVEAGVRRGRDTGRVTSVFAVRERRPHTWKSLQFFVRQKNMRTWSWSEAWLSQSGGPSPEPRGRVGCRVAWPPPPASRCTPGPHGTVWDPPVKRPRPMGPPCLLARGLTRAKGPLSGASSRHDCSGPASLTLPPGLPPSPREATLHVLC